MDNAGPSRTALLTAHARAYHQIVDRPPILDDPLAATLLGVTPEELVNTHESSDRPTAGTRSRRLFFAARARFAEDRISTHFNTGTRQVVVLGAGMDTFAYRNPHPGLRVFEVDHPATQAWKRERLAASGILVPDSLAFVPVNFETDALATQLADAGFDTAEPAVFVWLGVIFYLTPAAARGTLECIANRARPVEVIFDYLRPGDTEAERARLHERADRLSDAGEPWFSYFTPEEIATTLSGIGFTEVDDHSATELIAGYLDGTTGFDTDEARSLNASRILRAGR